MAAVHGHGQGPTVWGAQQGSHGLQEAHCDAWHLRVPLADSGQLLTQGLLQRQGKRARTGALPPGIWAQWEDLEQQGQESGGGACGAENPHTAPVSEPCP